MSRQADQAQDRRGPAEATDHQVNCVRAAALASAWVTGLTIDQVLDPRHGRAIEPFCTARMLMVWLLHDVLAWGPTFIGRMLGIPHSNVHWYVRQFEGYIETEPRTAERSIQARHYLMSYIVAVNTGRPLPEMAPEPQEVPVHG